MLFSMIMNEVPSNNKTQNQPKTHANKQADCRQILKFSSGHFSEPVLTYQSSLGVDMFHTSPLDKELEWLLLIIMI